MLLCGIATFTNAQNYATYNVWDIINEQGRLLTICTDSYDGVIIYDDPNHLPSWRYNGFPYEEWPVHVYADSLVLYAPEAPEDMMFYDCAIYSSVTGGSASDFFVMFISSLIKTPFLNSCVWKQVNESMQITTYNEEDIYYSYWNGYEYLAEVGGGFMFSWSTGETERSITVNEPGIYSLQITDLIGCAGDTTFYIQVRDNVELYRATVDLETNLNKATWQVTEEQAEYISEVKVYRDGLLVGTAPYEDGYYLDAIGSDNAARNYKIVGVSVEGEDCPIASYEKGTIHTTYYEDVNGNLNMTWNIPYVEEGAQGTLTYFQICKYDPNTGEITVVDQVNSSITDYTCGVNQFDGGYAVIAAVFNDGKGVEELSFSNLTTDILGIEEDGLSTGLGTFTVYPNPAKDRVTIEGTGKAIITNALGQTILTKEIDGKETIELPRGMYFVKMNGVTRKIVVE